MTDPLSVTFQALADPTRRAILARLAAGEASVNDLAAPFDISLPAVSRHLKVLEAEALQRAWSWIEHYRRFWDASFDRMAAYLAELQAEEAQTPSPKDTEA